MARTNKEAPLDDFQEQEVYFMLYDHQSMRSPAYFTADETHLRTELPRGTTTPTALSGGVRASECQHFYFMLRPLYSVEERDVSTLYTPRSISHTTPLSAL